MWLDLALPKLAAKDETTPTSLLRKLQWRILELCGENGIQQCKSKIVIWSTEFDVLHITILHQMYCISALIQGENQLNLLSERAKIIWKFAMFEVRSCVRSDKSTHQGVCSE